MTDLRTAAQQALEALEYAQQDRECPSTTRQAITAIRAALAEPVQEPAAKVELMTAGGNAGLATRIVEIDDHLRERLRPGQLLYTAPPQRKPLTEEEITQCFKDAGIAIKGQHWTNAVRNVERAHGITS